MNRATPAEGIRSSSAWRIALSEAPAFMAARMWVSRWVAEPRSQSGCRPARDPWCGGRAPAAGGESSPGARHRRPGIRDHAPPGTRVFRRRIVGKRGPKSLNPLVKVLHRRRA
jgi:hypothetical protein